MPSTAWNELGCHIINMILLKMNSSTLHIRHVMFYKIKKSNKAAEASSNIQGVYKIVQIKQIAHDRLKKKKNWEKLTSFS